MVFGYYKVLVFLFFIGRSWGYRILNLFDVLDIRVVKRNLFFRGIFEFGS